MSDLGYALRQLRRSPGFTSVAVLTLALGIAGTTSIFSVVEGVLLRSLPYRDPGRLVALWATDSASGADHDYVSFPDLQDWRRQAHEVRGLAAFDAWHGTLTFRGQPARRVNAGTASPEFFSTLGTPAELGRTFRPGDGEPGSPPVVVLSDAMWRQRFGGAADIIGRDIPVDGRSYRVVGVLPASFRFPALPDARLWRPLAVPEPIRSERGNHFLRVVGRLSPGATVASAGREMSIISRRLARAHPESNAGKGIQVVSLREDIVGGVRPALLLLLGAVGLVLLIACANIASLSLTRALARRSELAVRAALGAGRARLVRQLLSESLVLALAGGAIGTLASVWAVHVLIGLVPGDLPRASSIGVDVPVLLVSLATSLAAGVAFGVLPAAWAGRIAGSPALREAGDRSGPGRRTGRIRLGLVVGEIMLAVVLTVSAGLLVKSFAGVREVNPGLAPQRVLTFGIDLWPARYDEKAAVRDFSSRLLGRLRELPGVASVSAVTGLPFTDDNDMVAGFRRSDRPEPAPGHRSTAKLSVVMPDYFRTLGIPLLQGRALEDRDDGRAPPVVVINRAMARRYFPGEDPIGRRIEVQAHTSGETPGPREIGGVVGDVHQYGLETAPSPEMYVPQLQFPVGALTVTLRTSGRPQRMVPAVRSAVGELDPDLAVSAPRTMDAILSRSIAQPRFYALVVALFSALALVLCALGVYGVIAFGVRRRSREIGIRMAVGAGGARILRLVLREALLMGAVGVALGLGLALAVSRLLSGLLYHVRPVDPAVYALVATAVLAIAVLAAVLPARRATRVDPMSILRTE